MDAIIEQQLKDLWLDTDRPAQTAAFFAVIAATEQPVNWAYEIWDELLANLSHKDNHRRAISAQVLANLAKSDPEKRILRDFDRLWAITRDKGFVTARHSLQSFWKIGLAGAEEKQRLVKALTLRFAECATEKNGSLIRYDIIADFRKLYDATQDESLCEKALALIETESDLKYKKKYAGLWKK